nr:immunoglobulin heavy chain junction region [Macaca mulatta]MOX00662.1 immunoglobulin heavy chain junction region [Macaca mulatta]MOX02268.1 immunoglobulin heavy chain junction region [Macaca mulatta]MOX03160.1 immunoglobulin heavy chain junction region [Macaca mulatta]MOX03696.1 immunoglobulin heavy chain junction region [Macaca mulatta]
CARYEGDSYSYYYFDYW